VTRPAIVNRAEAETLRGTLGEECPELLVSAPVSLSAPMPFLFDLRVPADRLPAFGTYCSPVPFFPVGEPERERPPGRLPPLVSASWVSLAASLASTCSTSALRAYRSASAAGTSNVPPGSTSPMP
jgi:hypothetical protein